MASSSFLFDPLPTIEVPHEALDDRTPPGDAPPASPVPLADMSHAPAPSFASPVPLADISPAPARSFSTVAALVDIAPSSFVDVPRPLDDIVTPLAGIAVPLDDLPPPIRAGTRDGVTSLADVAVAAHEAPTVSFRAPTPPQSFASMPPSIVAASRAVRRWRAAAVAGLAAFAVTVLAGVVLRHGSDSRPAPNAAVVVPRSAAPAVPAAPVAPMRAPAARAQATRAGGADETD